MHTAHSENHPLSLFKDKKSPMSLGFQNKLASKSQSGAVVDKAEANIEELIEEEFKIANEGFDHKKGSTTPMKEESTPFKKNVQFENTLYVDTASKLRSPTDELGEEPPVTVMETHRPLTSD